MSSPHQPQRWEKLESRPIAQTRVFDVTGTQFRHPGRAQTREFFLINAPDWVNVIALTKNQELVLVRQFRYGTNDFSLEIPGGVMDSGEDPLTTAARELVEETGYTGSPPRLLGTVSPNPAIQTNRCHLVLIENCECTTPLEWDEDEEFEILTLPVDEVYARVWRGEITHALVLDALLLFWPHRPPPPNGGGK